MTRALAPTEVEAMRTAFFPLWRRRGTGFGPGQCVFCGAFLVSQGGVVFENAHADGCGFADLCNALGFEP